MQSDRLLKKSKRYLLAALYEVAKKLFYVKNIDGYRFKNIRGASGDI
jgi:hypothetical protein